MSPSKNFLVSVFTWVFLIIGNPGQAQMVVIPDRPDGIYEINDKIRWVIKWEGKSKAPVTHYVLKSGGLTKMGQGELSFSNNFAEVETDLEVPNTVLLEVQWQPESKTNRLMGGAVVAPGQIQPVAAAPDDFDKFWKARLKELRGIPVHPILEKKPSGKFRVDYWKVTMDNIRGSHIEGQIARPEKGKKFPALLILQWAGVYGLQKSWVADRAAEGWLAMDIEPHDFPIDESTNFYKDQFNGRLKDYWSIGNDDRNTSYYLRMYLSCYQAVEYLKTRPDWDGKTLVVMGDSQGGQQAIMIAGLHPKNITAALAFIPAGGDMLGPNQGRAPGFPGWYFNTKGKDPAKVRQASRYYDVANFARHIKCPILVGLGLLDETCPPSSVLATVNQIASPKEVIILPKSGHKEEHGTQNAYNERRYGAWLAALRQGRPAPMFLGFVH